jgi:hypothetical protein
MTDGRMMCDWLVTDRVGSFDLARGSDDDDDDAYGLIRTPSTGRLCVATYIA